MSRRYRRDTLILETTFETADGTVTVTDFMPPRGAASELVRIVRGERGRVAMRMHLTVRFDYGAILPWVTQDRAAPGSSADNTLTAIAGPDRVLLRTRAPLRARRPRPRRSPRIPRRSR